MLKRFLSLCSVFVVVLMISACGGSSGSQKGSATIDLDLRISSIVSDIEDFDPVFDQDRTGVYVAEVAVDVSSVSFTIGSPLSEESKLSAFRRVAATNDNLAGREEEQIIEVGSEFTFTVTEGDNLFIIRSETIDGKQAIEYRFTVHRISSDATLSDLALGDNLTTDASLITFDSPSEFSPDVTEYVFSVPFEVCTVRVFPVLSNRYSEVTINGSEFTESSSYVELVGGENTVELDVIPEDGSDSQLYTLTINRAEPTDGEIENLVTLGSLNLDSGALDSGGIEGFHCQFQSYTARVNNNVETVNVSAIPNIDTRTVLIGEVVIDATTLTSSLTNTVEIPADASVPVSVSIGAGNLYGISLANDEDDNPIVHYTILIERGETNWVEVSSGEALQAALQAAQPNQEIILQSATYTGDATELASGKEGVHFYSEASGTEEEPIVLRGNGQSLLTGSSMNTGTVLQLSGDYWRVSSIEISNAATGLVFDDADSNYTNLLRITDMGKRGIELRNGSDNNSFARITISDVGAEAAVDEDSGEAIVIGSAGSTWVSAPTPGLYESTNTNNTFSNLVVGPNVAGELIDIKEGAEGTRVQYSEFDSRDIGAAAEQAAAIVIKGNAAEISYNSFYHQGATDGFSGISILDAPDAWHSEAWGENTLVFHNVFDFDGSGAPAMVTASDDVDYVGVADNTRNDGGSVSYSGAAIDQSFSSPYYQIQLVSDDTKCVEREAVDVLPLELDDNGVIVVVAGGEPLGAIDLAVVSDCASTPTQLWRFGNESDQVVRIRNTSDLGLTLAPNDKGNFVASSAGLITLIADVDSSLDQSYFLRWVVNGIDNNQVVMTNKFNQRFAMTLSDLSIAYDTDKQVIATSVNTLAEGQRFTLVPQ